MSLYILTCLIYFDLSLNIFKTVDYCDWHFKTHFVVFKKFIKFKFIYCSIILQLIYVNIGITLLYNYVRNLCIITILVLIYVYYQNPSDQNPLAFKIRPFFSLFILYIFCFYYWFVFTITVIPNPYPRLVSGSRIWLGGFRTRVDFERVP